MTVRPAVATEGSATSVSKAEALPRRASPGTVDPGGVSLLKLESWLDSDSSENSNSRNSSVAQKEGSGENVSGAPLRAPPQHGWVLEAGLGAIGHIGSMSQVSPTAPLLRAQLGYEICNWLMASIHSDMSLTDTRYASRNFESRPYALVSGGVGLRLGWRAFSSVGFTLQADGGLGKITEDVLDTYGYRNAARFRPHYSGIFAVEWYQVSPRHALRFFGGSRSYRRTFRRVQGDPSAWAWLGGVAVRYVL